MAQGPERSSAQGPLEGEDIGTEHWEDARHCSRFANRDAYASYNGTAPIEWSSGGRGVHRVSRRGNRKLNHAVHMAGVT